MIHIFLKFKLFCVTEGRPEFSESLIWWDTLINHAVPSTTIFFIILLLSTLEKFKLQWYLKKAIGTELQVLENLKLVLYDPPFNVI